MANKKFKTQANIKLHHWERAWVNEQAAKNGQTLLEWMRGQLGLEPSGDRLAPLEEQPTFDFASAEVHLDERDRGAINGR